ncbi:MAG TPA: radical SAM protein [Bacteroidales bacterium]|nr:radical SAM protein [Bacteroidales bacterium]HPT03077.1 radical SAM protein [Bacteroidales bacterium]
MTPRHFAIPVFVPELACPNRCVFCNQRNISGTMAMPQPDEVAGIIEKHLATIPPDSETEIGFFGGNFTGIEPSLQQSFLEIAEKYVRAGKAKSIRLSTRPDYIDDRRLSLLKQFSVQNIELGAQSLDGEVLRLSGRGHTVYDVEKASELILENGFRLGLQMMTGLPGDTPARSVATARKIVALGASDTRIYPTLVIRDTELEKMYHAGSYVPLSLDEAVESAAVIAGIFEEAGVKILRIGLHPSEGLLSGESLVAGPFHVAFGELVATAQWSAIFRQKLAGNSSGVNENLLAEVPPGQINAAVGHKSLNKKMLLTRFRKVVFRENKELSGKQCRFIVSSTD